MSNFTSITVDYNKCKTTHVYLYLNRWTRCLVCYFCNFISTPYGLLCTNFKDVCLIPTIQIIVGVMLNSNALCFSVFLKGFLSFYEQSIIGRNDNKGIDKNVYKFF